MYLPTKSYLRWLGALVLVVGLGTTANAQRTVTLTLNTATLPDTTSASVAVEVRGAVDPANDGNLVSPYTLPDGNVISWGDDTSLNPTNIGGDYWQVSFQIPDNAPAKFKFFSPQAENSGAGIGGWEDGADHEIAAGTGDLELPLHYYEKGDDKAYDWSPFESKTDSVGVLFRVYMNTEAAIPAGYDRSNADMVLGVRGNDFTAAGPLDWGTTKVTLTPESDDDTRPGYDLFSGVAYYSTSLSGTEQAFKFFVEPEGWEANISDRTFTIPAQDTTLQWVAFDDSPVITGSGPQTATVLFAVDLSPMEAIGVFDRARGDTLEARGEFNGWACGPDNQDSCLLSRVPGEDTFEAAIPVTAVPGGNVNFKFFLNLNDEAFRDAFGVDPPSGWEEPINTQGANRAFVFDGNPSADQDLGVLRFNDVFDDNVISDAYTVDVTFTVDMANAVTNQAAPFNPANGDSVFVQFADPIWAFTQGIESFTPSLLLTDDDGDGIFSGTISVAGPTYSGIQYNYTYGQIGAYTAEPEGGFSGPGRRRTRFILPNGDGTWPEAVSFVPETYQVTAPDGGYPFDPNPSVLTAVEPVGTGIPSQISLGENYPNPFNPSTAFEYTINDAQLVTVRIFDVTGRLVDTLVDGLQPASTYRVTFDAASLSSGVYFYQLKTANQTLTRKMLLMK